MPGSSGASTRSSGLANSTSGTTKLFQRQLANRLGLELEHTNLPGWQTTTPSPSTASSMSGAIQLSKLTKLCNGIRGGRKDTGGGQLMKDD
eukprot:357568-Hanusia_phi.AAC.1